MSRFPQFNVNNEHQLIRRQNTFVLDRKLVTIHSEDRDINKWPSSNHFEVTIPEDVTNVQSMRLVEINLPGNHYTFSNSQQNTKMSFSIQPNVSNNTDEYNILLLLGRIMITIPDGYYCCPDEMALELENRMNQSVTNLVSSSPSPPATSYIYNRFKVIYDTVSQTIYFGNTYDGFTLLFSEPEIYDNSCEYMNKPGKNSGGPAINSNGNIVKINKPVTSNSSSSNTVWNYYTKWGLPAYLGFAKQEYIADDLDASGAIYFNAGGIYTWQLNNPWLQIDASFGSNGIASYVAAPFTLNILGESIIYMEFEKYNSIDELRPYPNNTNDTYNNDYNGRVNSAFAKIPITNSCNVGQIIDSRNGFLQNVSQYNPPIDKIRKVKVTFRYHDGRLVQFKDSNFSFTIAFNQLRDEISRDYDIRVPQEYLL